MHASDDFNRCTRREWLEIFLNGFPERLREVMQQQLRPPDRHVDGGRNVPPHELGLD